MPSFIDDTQVFHVNTTNLEFSSENFDETISCLALRSNATGVSRVLWGTTRNSLTLFQLACTTAQGFAVLTGNSGITYISKPIDPEKAPFTRFNDGGCDSEGRFFAGTIYNQERGIPGQLYRYDPSTMIAEVVDEGPFTVS